MAVSGAMNGSRYDPAVETVPEAKSTSCAHRRLGFRCQTCVPNTRGSVQLSVTPVSRNSTRPSGFLQPQAYTCYTYINVGEILYTESKNKYKRWERKYNHLHFLIFISMCACMSMYLCVHLEVKGQPMDVFSPSVMWVSGTEVRWSGWLANAFPG